MPFRECVVVACDGHHAGRPFYEWQRAPPSCVSSCVSAERPVAYAAPAAVSTVGPGPPIQKGRNASGPPGANLFIFHIPNDMTNRDVYNMFSPYGNVASARIMVERETGRSRGFGYVSSNYNENTRELSLLLQSCGCMLSQNQELPRQVCMQV